MRANPDDKFFVFMSREKAAVTAARKLLEDTAGIEIVDGFSGTFRVRTTQIIADQFKTAHPEWIVTPEQYIPAPRPPHLRIKKGPE